VSRNLFTACRFRGLADSRVVTQGEKAKKYNPQQRRSGHVHNSRRGQKGVDNRPEHDSLRADARQEVSCRTVIHAEYDQGGTSMTSRQEIIDLMEKFQKGDALVFKTPKTFGDDYVVIELNPESGKKYVLRLGKDLEAAKKSVPYYSHDHAKPIAKWIADRCGEPLG